MICGPAGASAPSRDPPAPWAAEAPPAPTYPPVPAGAPPYFTLAQKWLTCRPSPPPHTSKPAKMMLRYWLLFTP